jgi:hypothetical protein
MQPTLTFHDLPAEIRVAIYKLYFTVDGGYRYNHGSTKLTKADGEAINLSLLLASRLVAQEATPIPLQVNALHFSTGSSRFENTYAGYHDVNMHSKAEFLYEVNDWLWLAETPEMYDRVVQKYPQFSVVLDTISYPVDAGEWLPLCGRRLPSLPGKLPLPSTEIGPAELRSISHPI